MTGSATGNTLHALAAAALATVAPLLTLGGCTAARSPSQPAVPAVPGSLAAPPGQTLAITAHGIGVQIYECTAAKTDPAAFEWILKGPQAQLHYDAGKDLGRHYAGPTWEANDGSKVVGEVVARDPGPDPTAIPWLLLRATANAGDGVFSGVVSIQRLRTVGGKAPDEGCSKAYAGSTVRVNYSADYLFYTARRLKPRT